MNFRGVLVAALMAAVGYSDVALAVRNNNYGTDMRQTVDCTYGYVDGVLDIVLCQVVWVNDFNQFQDVYETQDWLDTYAGIRRVQGVPGYPNTSVSIDGRRVYNMGASCTATDWTVARIEAAAAALSANPSMSVGTVVTFFMDDGFREFQRTSTQMGDYLDFQPLNGVTTCQS